MIYITHLSIFNVNLVLFIPGDERGIKTTTGYKKAGCIWECIFILRYLVYGSCYRFSFESQIWRLSQVKLFEQQYNIYLFAIPYLTWFLSLDIRPEIDLALFPLKDLSMITSSISIPFRYSNFHSVYVWLSLLQIW